MSRAILTESLAPVPSSCSVFRTRVEILEGSFTGEQMQKVSSKRTYSLVGDIVYDSMRKFSEWYRERFEEDPEGWISLEVTSCGGGTYTASAMIDLMLHIRKVNIQTVALGDVSSMAVPLFMAGGVRVVSPRTHFFLHELGRTFEGSTRWTTRELRNVASNLETQEKLYSEFVALRSDGKLTSEQVLKLMQVETHLYGKEAVDLGLAHEVVE